MNDRLRAGLGLCSTVVLLWAIPVVAFEKTAAKNAETPLQKLYRQIGREKYSEAKKLIEPLYNQVGPADQKQLEQIYARILLGLGDARGARTQVARLKIAARGGPDQELAAAYESWLTALDGKPDQAIKALEALLQKNQQTQATAEAADILATLYLKKGDRKEAQRVVGLGLQTIQYGSLTTRYEETLLRRRLKDHAMSDDALGQLYEKGVSLLGKKSYREALDLFDQVTKANPASPWAAAATFRIGECLVGLNQPAQALELWTGFIKASPAGPWRAQAYVGSTDVVLKLQLDLKKASELTARAAEILAGPLAADAEPSWKKAAYDIWLRRGLLALINRDFDGSQTALTEARRQTKSPKDLVDKLLALVHERPVLRPDDLGDGQQPAVVAAALGFAWHGAGQEDQARSYFTMVITGRLRGNTQACRSYAAFGMGKILTAEKNYSEAMAAFEHSLQWFPAASWHDVTLRDVALMVEQFADDKAKAATSDSKPVARDKTKTKAVAAESPTTARAIARGQAIPHWASLYTRYPKSPYVPQALYHAGVLYADSAQPQPAIAAFERITRDHPQSVYAGAAHVRMVDTRLKVMFDIPGAATHVAAALKWLAETSPKTVAAGDDPWGVPTYAQTAYEIHLRAGVIAFLNGKKAEALDEFSAAKSIAPPVKLAVTGKAVPTGVGRLIEVAKTGKSLTPSKVLEGDPQVKLMLLLADMYYEAEDYEQTLDLCNQVLENGKVHASTSQKSWAYFKRGRTLYGRMEEKQKSELEAVYRDYAAAVKGAPDSEWAYKALFLAANLQWNENEDPAQAIALWTRLIQDYPKCDEAARSAFYIATVYQWTGDHLQARKAFRKALDGYAASPFSGLMRDGLAETEKQIADDEADHRGHGPASRSADSQKDAAQGKPAR